MFNRVNRYIYKGKVQAALREMEGMVEQGKMYLVENINHRRFLTACSTKRATEEAVRFVQLLDSKDPRVYNMLMSTCVRGKDVNGAFQAWDMMRAEGLKPGKIFYSNLINACAQANQANRAFEVFQNMLNDGVKPDQITFCILINSCARELRKRKNRRQQLVLVERAFHVLDDMKSMRVRPDAHIYNALLACCARTGLKTRALSIYQQMLDEGIPSNAATYLALMDAHIAANDCEGALEIFENVQPRILGFKSGKEQLYNSAIHACQHLRDFDRALGLYSKMKADCILPDPVLFATLMKAAAETGNIDKTADILSEMKIAEVGPSVSNYSTLIGIHAKNSDYEKAQETYDEMIAHNIKPTVVVMNSLAHAYAKSGMVRETFEIVEEMKSEGLSPNSITCSVLLSSCYHGREIEKAFEVYNEARQQGMQVNESCTHILILIANRVLKSLRESPILHGTPGGTSSHHLQAIQSQRQAWAARAVSLYHEAVNNGVHPSLESLSLLFGCLRLPRHKMDGFSTSSTEGAGLFESRALFLYEDASSRGMVPAISVDAEQTFNLEKLPPVVGQVLTLCLIRRLYKEKGVSIGGFRCRNIVFEFPPVAEAKRVKKHKETVEGNPEPHVNYVGASVVNILRRMSVPFEGSQHEGYVRMNGAALDRWLKSSSGREVIGQQDLSYHGLNDIYKSIHKQNEKIRTSSYHL